MNKNKFLKFIEKLKLYYIEAEYINDGFSSNIKKEFKDDLQKVNKSNNNSIPLNNELSPDIIQHITKIIDVNCNYMPNNSVKTINFPQFFGIRDGWGIVDISQELNTFIYSKLSYITQNNTSTILDENYVRSFRFTIGNITNNNDIYVNPISGNLGVMLDWNYGYYTLEINDLPYKNDSYRFLLREIQLNIYRL